MDSEAIGRVCNVLNEAHSLLSQVASDGLRGFPGRESYDKFMAVQKAIRQPDTGAVAKVIATAYGGNAARWLDETIKLVDDAAHAAAAAGRTDATGLLDSLQARKDLLMRLPFAEFIQSESEPDERGVTEQGAVASAEQPASGVSLEARALAILTDNPGMSLTEIAKKLGCERTSLYRLPKFRAALAVLKESGKAGMATGFKAADGTLDAWGDD